tara:strand:- start:148 stop:591 length:444 start_codon:yes stop_codon:yes gene_type:complete
MRLLLINGPNLNLLGQREPKLYGSNSLELIEKNLILRAKDEGYSLECFQSNSEGEILDRIHNAIGNVNGILINAGALTHTSIALRDALIGSDIPYVELHLTNIYGREKFRHHSYLSERAIGVVCGFREYSYLIAMQGLLNYLKESCN